MKTITLKVTLAQHDIDRLKVAYWESHKPDVQKDIFPSVAKEIFKEICLDDADLWQSFLDKVSDLIEKEL